ncbi:hypothetical protein SAMN05216571_101248 [Onishia taeanensis]|uniref:Uncharacterized protein n=1 Tax=Onishia taeanensis TaxID=284577 RepID=A0A1G7N670_9GAMM|nr:hypothetical protein [Halomonas taeanensis]SDF69446.1 hypothetical protein SAMN05216571_101248 [Halomonas taeanensis]
MAGNSVHDDGLLQQLLEEQRRTNHLLVILIEALAEDEGDEDSIPATYLDGASR